MRSLLPIFLAACGGSEVVSFPDASAVFDAAQLPNLVPAASLMMAPPTLVSFRVFPGSSVDVEGCAKLGIRELLTFDVAIVNVGSVDFLADPTLGEISPTHGHVHIKGMADYRLLREEDGEEVVSTHKQSFCLRDDERVIGTSEARYTCDEQGISVGWADVYGHKLLCQWLDVTDVYPGRYVIEVELNPEGLHREMTREDNVWRTEWVRR